MTNKYRGVDLQRFLPGGGEEPEPIEGLFDGGLVLDRSVQDMEFNQSPDLNAVRLEKGGLRADFGKSAMGGVPSPNNNIRALGEHRFVDATATTFSKIFRLYRNAGGKAKLDSWDGAAWQNEHDSATVNLQNVLVDWKSYFNIAFFADGVEVFKWDRSNLVADQGDDFTAANSLFAQGHEVTATIAPAVAVGDRYDIHFKATITGPGKGSFRVVATHDGYAIGEKIINVSENFNTSRSEVLAHEIIEATKAGITNGETITLRLENINRDEGLVANIYETMTDSGGVDPKYVYDKGNNRIPTNKDFHLGMPCYEFVLSLDGTAATSPFCSIEFFFFDATGAAWEKVASSFLLQPQGVISQAQWQLIHDPQGYPNVTKVGFQIAAASIAAGWGYSADPIINYNDSFGVAVHGFNLAGDGDPSQGVTYRAAGSTQGNTLEYVYKDAPSSLILRARYLGVIANRVAALQVDGDPQKIIVCANGNPFSWSGDGTDERILAGESDPVDALMALEALTANVWALFRERSIMRAVPTGILNPPVAYFPWIETLGTESPFSVARTPWGIMFVGNDKQVYLLTEAGPQATGWFINESFEIADLSTVEGVYDSETQEYILTVPS